MTLDLGERRCARLLVSRRVEIEAVAKPEPMVALGPEIRPRPGEGEVDIEDDGAKRGPQHESAG